MDIGLRTWLVLSDVAEERTGETLCLWGETEVKAVDFLTLLPAFDYS